MKKSIFMLLAVALLVSCSKSQFVDPTETGDVAFQSKSTLQTVGVETSRAPFIGEISADNTLEARVLTSTVDGNYATTYANGKMTFIGGVKVSAYDPSTLLEGVDHARFPKDAGSTPYYITGLYPYTDWAVAGTTAAISFTGKEDVLAAAQQPTNRDDVLAGIVPGLIFNHLLTKLEVSVKAANNQAKDNWGKVTEIKLIKVLDAAPKDAATVTLKTGEATFSGAASSVALYNLSADTSADPDVITYTDNVFNALTAQPLAETATPIAYTMIAPFVGGTDLDLTFEISTEYQTAKQVKTVKLPYAGLNNGRAFGITFTFSATDAIQATAKVIDWIFSGNAEVTID
jgi:hypothetical protein